jgi:hypothetical protein
LLQVFQGLPADVSARHLEFGRNLPAEHFAEAWNVVVPIAQRWKVYWYPPNEFLLKIGAEFGIRNMTWEQATRQSRELFPRNS